MTEQTKLTPEIINGLAAEQLRQQRRQIDHLCKQVFELEEQLRKWRVTACFSAISALTLFVMCPL
jgi:hypothetical protein